MWILIGIVPYSFHFRFLNKMQNGFADYGCCIQNEKTVTNFKSQNPSLNVGSGSTNKQPVNGEILSEMRSGLNPNLGVENRKQNTQSDLSELSFCGSVIDPLSLCCRPDFSSYFGRNIVYASTLNCWYSSNNFTT
jgi:hypothetical protein